MCFCFKGKISSVNFYLPQLLCSRRRTTLNIPLLDNLAQYVTLCLWLTKSLDGRECAASRNFSVILKNGKKRTYFQTGTTCQKNHVHFHIMKTSKISACCATVDWGRGHLVPWVRSGSDCLHHENVLWLPLIFDKPTSKLSVYFRHCLAEWTDVPKTTLRVD